MAAAIPISHVPLTPRTLTWTGVRTLRECRRRFQQRYVLRREEPASEPLERGSGVHEILEAMGRAARAGRPVEGQALTELVESRAALLQPEAADDLREIIYRYAERDQLPGFPSDATDVDFERTFAIGADGEPLEWDDESALFRSVFDQVYRENGGTLAVVRDFKTSRAIESPGEQMRDYAWAATRLWPEIESVVAELHYVRYGAVRRGEYQREDLAPVLTELRVLRAVVESGLRDDEWPTRVSSACTWCGYAADCPAMGTASLVQIRTPDEAREQAEALVADEVRIAQRRAALAAWVKANGPVDVGDEVIGYVPRTKESAEAAAAAAVLLEHGVSPDDLWANVSLPSAALKKLVTISISSAPRNERREARERRMRELRAAGGLVARVDVEFRRQKKGTEEISDD